MFPEILSDHQRATHTYVIGQPGTGKSRALESWAMQDILAGKGVGVIDPHGDLFRHLQLRIAKLPQVWERVVIINPLHRKWTVSINPLAPIPGVPVERIAGSLADTVLKVWKIDPVQAPRLVWLLSNTFLALAELRLTLLDLTRFLLDGHFRGSLLSKLENGRAKEFFIHEYPTSHGAAQQWVAPLLNKLGRLLFDPDIRPMLAGENTLNFRQVLDQGLVLIVNIPKGRLGEGASALLGAFLVSRLQQAALSRADTALRQAFYLYLDEFQHYTTNNVADILAESRKYGLSLTLAHQYLDQLDPQIRSAALNTAGSLVCFRVGYDDANRLAKEIFPSPDYLLSRHPIASLNLVDRLPRLPVPYESELTGWSSLAQALTSLPQRHFWARQRGRGGPNRHRTFDMPNPTSNAELYEHLAQLQDISGGRFGRLKYGQSGNLSSGKDGSSNQSDIPFWNE